MGKLMNKYQLLDNDFTFEYVQNCEDVKKLRRIIEVLRSGELGHFPVLQEKAVQKLRGLDPENNHLSDEKLRPLVREKVDLSDWESEMKEQEAIMVAISKAAPQNLPEIRTQHRFQHVNIDGKKSNDLRAKRYSKEKLSTKEYYEHWEEYDAETDILQVDLEEERRKEEERQAEVQRKNDTLDSTLTLEEIAENSSKLPDHIRTLLADTARETGNEHFKDQEYRSALNAYSKSIAYKPTCIASNNRAMTLIKIGDHRSAMADCNFVLAEEPDNVKALYRRSSCYNAMEDYKNSFKDLERVLVLEPNNKLAQNDFKAVRKKLNIVDNAPKFKIQIEDVASDNIPLMFYGQSSSRFFYYPYNRPREMGGYIPCKCNRGSRLRHPLCRKCGELMMINCERSRVVCKNMPPMYNANEVIKLCREQKTNFIIHNSTYTRNKNAVNRTVKKMQLRCSAMPAVEVANMPASARVVAESSKPNLNVVHKALQDSRTSQAVPPANVVEMALPSKPPPPVATQEPAVSIKASLAEVMGLRSQVMPRVAPSIGKASKAAEHDKSSRSPENYKHGKAHNKRNLETMLKEELSRKQVLAEDAKKRGDVLSQSGLYPLSLRYYTTSINLFPQVETLLSRATDHIRMKNFAEAVADCTEALKMEPNNVVAYLRRATAYISMPAESNALKMAISDFQHVLDLKPTDWAVQQDAAKLMELITERNQMPTPPIKLCGHRKNTPVRRVNPPATGDAACKVVLTRLTEKELAVAKTAAEARKGKDPTQPNPSGPPIAVTNGQGPKPSATNAPPPRHPLITNITRCKSDGDEKLIYKVNEPAERSEKKSGSPVHTADKSGTFKKKQTQNSMVFTSSAAKAATTQAEGTGNGTEKPVVKESNALSGVQKKGPVNSKPKSKKSGRAQSNGPPTTSSFQFFSQWENQKKSDKSFKERAAILRSVPPDQLSSVVGEKLDGDMLNELVESLSVMSMEEPEAAAEYLKCLPDLPRFEPVKLFLGAEDINRAMNLIEALQERNVVIEEDVKRALL